MSTKKDKTLLGFLTRYFLQGLFVLLPLTITVAILFTLANFFIQQLGPQTIIGSYLTRLGIRIAGDSILAYFIGIGVVIAAIFLMGFILDYGARKYIRMSIDSIMQQIPLINKLYNISVKIVDMINRDEQEEFKGMQVVYCFFGGERGAAFLALMPTPEIYTVRGMDYHIILVPSAPVPVGGSMMLVPKDSVEIAGIPIEDFSQVYLSMGASCEGILPKREQSIN